MARLVRIERQVPYKIEPAAFPQNGKSIWICGCGLSKTMPYCDQTHKGGCVQEKPGMLYEYDPVTKEVVSERPDPNVPPPSETAMQP